MAYLSKLLKQIKTKTMFNKPIFIASFIAMIFFCSCMKNKSTNLNTEYEIEASSNKKNYEASKKSVLAIQGIYIPKYIKARIHEKQHLTTPANSLQDIPGIYVPRYVLLKVKENQQQKPLNFALIENKNSNK